MCHRRGEWSRTSSRASETEAETERGERAGWTVRAKERLAALVSGVSEAESPEQPTADRGPETPSADAPEREAPTETEAPTEEPEDEREEEPIPADD
jgi:hypothetical protein